MVLYSRDLSGKFIPEQNNRYAINGQQDTPLAEL